MAETLTVQQVLDSKAFIGGGVTYKTPREYVSRFLDIAETFSPEYEVRVADEVNNANEDGSINTAYGKVYIKARTRLSDEFSYSAGILYAIGQRPVIKVFSGLDVNACFNLTIFGAENIEGAFLTDGNFSRIYESASMFIQNRMQQFEEYTAIINRLKETHLDKLQLHNRIGYLLEQGIKDSKLGTQSIVVGAKSLYDPKSKYAISEEGTTEWNVYNSITEAMKSSDISVLPDKTVKLSKYFN